MTTMLIGMTSTYCQRFEESYCLHFHKHSRNLQTTNKEEVSHPRQPFPGRDLHPWSPKYECGV